MAAVLDAVRAFFAPPAAPAFVIDTEAPADVVARKKSSEKIRRDRVPAEGLAIVARDRQGHVIGTVRLWNIEAGVSREGRPVDALLLGPLAVDAAHEGKGIGSALMRAAMLEARRREHGAILLVGDAAYYERFGFFSDKAQHLVMPGPFARERFLGLELKPGWLDGAAGMVVASGRKLSQAHMRRVS